MSHEIDVEEAKRLIEEGATVVDVRTDEEFAAGHIPDSVHASMDAFAAHLGALEGREPMVLVCEIGEASGQAARLLDSYGGVEGDDVYNMAGGLEAWDGELVVGEEDENDEDGEESAGSAESPAGEV